MKRLIIILMILPLVFSCATKVEDASPQWIRSLKIEGDERAFLASELSDDRAYASIVRQIEEYVYADHDENAQFVLYSTGELPQYGATVVLSEIEDGLVHVLAVADADILEKTRSSNLDRIHDRDYRIGGLLDSYALSYRNNNDYEAFGYLVEAFIEASEGPVFDSEHEPDVIRERMYALADRLRIKTAKGDPSRGEVTVYLKRTSKFLSPNVLNAEIRAEYDATSARGEIYHDDTIFYTTKKGNFRYRPLNWTDTGKGTVRFTVYADPFIMRLEDAGYGAEAEYIRDAAERNGADFSYDMRNRWQDSTIAVSTTDLDLHLRKLDESISEKGIASVLDSYGIEHISVERSDDEIIQQIDEMRKSGTDADYLLVSSANVTETVEGDVETVVIEGRIQLWDIYGRKMVGDSLEVISSGNGSTYEEALKRAFMRYSREGTLLVLQL